MMTNYREMLGMMTLEQATGIAKEDRNLKQKKAIKNIKYCAEDQWQFVNSWYDCKDESARQYMMNANELFETIYKESQENIYGDGYASFGGHAISYLKDIRFCGKEFLQKVCFYYTAKLLEESVAEVDGTEGDAKKVYMDLKALKARIYGFEYQDIENVLAVLCHNVQNGDLLVENIAKIATAKIRQTRSHQIWVNIPRSFAIILSQYLKAIDSQLFVEDKRTNIRYYNDNVEVILNLGTNPYLWSTKK